MKYERAGGNSKERRHVAARIGKGSGRFQREMGGRYLRFLAAATIGGLVHDLIRTRTPGESILYPLDRFHKESVVCRIASRITGDDDQITRH